ncbi:hypothetical protein [Pseudoalteromonas sp. BSi20429]|uniref:hypothetical protein n=1 Tax=Pseudoalteromonas sp. BSi20429 TaxID=1097676 RepID=UPI0002317CF1|nr:hypothetical protein [Pseudoalteromonas sp. BSi20429]GAA68175.1 hypothetical protein P20429_2299 [Pseudoalteromonas sp. BSi20429]
MIIDLPTENDFNDSATNLLNLAWDQVVALLVEHEHVTENTEEESLEITDSERYWKAAKQTLTMSLSLVQQGVEFYMKGRIVSVSPYLLISGSPSSWPKQSKDEQHISFSRFRSIDAQDLNKVHDTVFKKKLSNEFVQWNKCMREERNKIIHTVDKNLVVTPESVIESILFAHEYFMGQKTWMQSRNSYLVNSPSNSTLYAQKDDLNKPYLIIELFADVEAITSFLEPSKIKRFFGFNKKARSLHCPKCYEEVSKMDFFDLDVAETLFKPYYQLESGDFQCVVCNHKGVLLNIQCSEEDCESCYVDEQTGSCLVCGHKNA